MSGDGGPVTGNELARFQREIKAMFAAQERKQDAHFETAVRMLSDLTESVRNLSVIEGRLERRLEVIQNLLTTRRMD